MSDDRLTVLGVDLDAQSRCAHYRGPTDIVAIRFKCCGAYYACVDCHAALANHQSEVWPRSEWNERAVLCGACQTELTVQAYLDSQAHCPTCAASFNPRCRNHYHLYFDVAG